MPDPRSEWPFSARAEELRLLTELVLDAAGGRAGAVVAGAAGVGKSRLAREVLQVARGRGFPVVTAIATRAAGRTPYGALAHLAPAHPLEYDDLGAWYRAFAAALPSGDLPVLLAVDDAQWLDEGAAALLLHLAQAGAARLLLTVRRGESVPEPVTTLWKDGLASRIDLQPLSAREVGQLVGAGLGGEVATPTATELARVSGGNVLFVRELVDAAVASGAMVQVHRVWRWDGSVVLAPRLVDVLDQRLAHLGDGEREALAVVALGEPLGLAEAGSLVGEDTLARLENAKLVRLDKGPDGHSVVTLGHPLYGEAVVGELGELERRRLVVRLADAIESRGRLDPVERLQVATWRLDAGDVVSPGELIEASELASRSFDPGLGERVARAALDAGGGIPAGVALARALIAANRFEEAESVLAPLEADVLAHEDADLHQAYLDRRHAALYMGLGRDEDMLAVFDRFDAAHARAQGDHRERAATLVGSYRSAVLLDQGRLEEVVDINMRVIEAAGASPLAQLYALENAGEALVYLGRTNAARELIARLAALGEGGEPDVARAAPNALMQEGMCLVLEGRPVEALEAIAPMLPFLEDIADPHVRGLAHLVVGGICLRRGTAARARSELVEAVAGFRRRDAGYALAWSLVMLAQAEALRGDLDAARGSFDEALLLHPPRRARMIADFALAKARLQVLEGDVTGASRTVLAAATDGGQLLLPRARLLQEAVELGAPASVVREDLVGIADAVECDYPRELLAHLDAMAARDGEGLEAAAGRFAAAGELLFAAGAAARAARAHDQAGNARGATRATAAGRGYAEQCEGARTPALEFGAGTPDLSAREAEVARLVAEGLSNTAVADRLSLSVRTVESHLYRVFGKLGVTQRRDVAGVLHARIK